MVAAATDQPVPGDDVIAALAREKEDLLKQKAYLDLKTEVEQLRDEVAQKAGKP